jgi:adenosylmethionine---8-amino-7-oxononanoate aminotransferase
MIHELRSYLIDNQTGPTVASYYFQNRTTPNFETNMAKTLIERDRKVIWHPYTQHQGMTSPIPVTRGQGSLLFDDKGNSYIDAISSWWVSIHGHGHPYIAKRIYEQAMKLEQVIFTGFTHEPAVELAERLLELLPGDLSKIFYSDNGSTAVEVALKMALQYWKNREKGMKNMPPGGKTRHGAERRRKILAFSHAYHGDTFGSMSVSGRGLFTAAFGDHLFETIFIDTPTADNIAELQSRVRAHGDEIACFIYEPLMQGAGGMRFHEAGPLDRLLDTIRDEGILSIADEVLTGFGRTGKLFAGEYLQNKPDMICLSKGLTGGTMALGATAATEKIFGGFLSNDRTKTFFHGHSFTANPIACSAALASLDLLQNGSCLDRIAVIAQRHRSFAVKLETCPVVRNIRILGVVIAFEIDAGKDEYLNDIGVWITGEALSKGIYLRPLGNTVYLMPPYCITDEELSQVYDFLLGTVGKL